jgi:tRNA-splicing ligase RtcB
MPLFGKIKGTVTEAKFWLPLEEVEETALAQIKNVINLPWVVNACFMPDVHAGKGCCIGSVIAMKNAVSPSLVGCDLFCGMLASKTNLKSSDIPEDLKAIRHQVERDIPVGFYWHKDTSRNFANEYSYLWEEFKLLDSRVQNLLSKAQMQLGTLGGSNHFIELCLDAEDNVWLMLHSGSRNIGKQLADIHISAAQTLAHNQDLPDPDLAVFLAGTKEMELYRRDINWAGKYALANREVMFRLYKNALLRFFPHVVFEEPIQAHHNYLAEEIHYGEELFVTRKGAIDASLGKKGIIPGCMGTSSFIVRGLGNPESLNSASHGAGRRLSRGKARKQFTVEDAKKQLAGVECKQDKSILDELPLAYKDIKSVMANQSDLVEIVTELRQILCVKG